MIQQENFPQKYKELFDLQVTEALVGLPRLVKKERYTDRNRY